MQLTMRWNESQRQAIEERGKNIIVSAAAGSGKTAVLVERILRLIIEDNTGVDQLLVVTFTKAAAAEMKERIGQAIKKAIKETEDSGKREFLKDQLEILGQASISTFHSFAMDLIKNYYYVADISPDLKPADDTQATLMKLDAMDQVFAQGFESEGNYEFIKLMNHYSSHKNETGIKNSLMSAYDRIMAMEEPFQWLNDKIEVLNSYDDIAVLQNQEIYPMVVEFYRNQLEKIYRLKAMIVDILDERGLTVLKGKQEPDLDPLKKWQQVLKNDISPDTFDQVRAEVSVYKFTTLRATKDEKEDYALVKDEIGAIRTKASDILKGIKADFGEENIIDTFKAVKENYPYLKEIQRILQAFHDQYSTMKLDKNLMDFNDMEHFALKILADEQVQKECRERFKYIFVDEYQDSNYIQEAIIAKIKRENNLFVVGDLKQSIYSFRLAEPDIFRARYKAYQNEDVSVKIDLNQNFRCKKNIIDGVNYVFEESMDDYDDAAKLHQGVNNESAYDFPVEVILAEEEFEDMDKDEFEDLLDIKKAEMEAMIIADRIENLIKSETKIYDNKKEIERKLEYRDIVILIRSVKNIGDILQKVLSKRNIPVFLNNNGGYFESTEIALLLNLLDVIDNLYKDIPLISVMYSCVFNFTIDELMAIRKQLKKDTFYQAVLEYKENGLDSKLIDKVTTMISKIENWQSQAKFMPLDQFVWKLINESGIYLDAGLKRSGQQRQLNLRTFVDKTKVYLSFGENSIYGLLNYFDMVKSNIETGPVSLVAKDEDTVQITTIHKSKGLEYPIVIIPSITKNFMRGGIGDGLIHIDRKIGIALKTHTKEGALKDNILVKMIQTSKQEEQREEEIRILYVGMTRAKDQLIMVGNVKNYGEYIDGLFEDMDKTTYLECILLPALEKRNTFKIKVMPKNQLISREQEDNSVMANKRTLAKLLKEPVSDQKLEKLNEKMQYKYQYMDEFNIRSKYGVTELNQKNKIVYDKEIVIPDFSQNEKEQMSSVHFGNIYHTVMEHMDFAKGKAEGRDYMENAVGQLADMGLLTEDEAKVINITKFENFISSQLGSRAADAKCYKEKQFTMKHAINGHDTLVQGVIDCYFVEDDEIVLVDYKTGKNVKETTENYIIQLELYKEALEKTTGKNVKEGWIYFFGNDQAFKAF